MPRIIATLPKKPKPEYDLTGLAPKPKTTAEAGLLFLNEIEKDAADSAKQLKKVVSTLEAVIAALEKKKKWKFNIDRNYTTGRIQEVTAELVE
jgi:hypothetical protein